MKAIYTSFWMEAKVSFTRDFLLLFLFSLSIFFLTFTDFPFQIIEEVTNENVGSLAIFSTLLAYLCLFLAIFCRSIFRDLENQTYFNQHPVNYQQHYLGKCFYIYFVYILISLISFAIPLLHSFYYADSLTSFNLSTLFDHLSIDLSTGFFMTGIVLFSSLFRPLHYGVLICIVSVFFYLAQSWPAISHLLPSFDEEYPAPLPFIIYAPIFWLLGMLMFEWKMVIAPKQKTSFLSGKLTWLKKLRGFKWITFTIPFILLAVIFKMAFSEVETIGLESSPYQKAKAEFMESVQQVKNQTKQQSKYFSFNFQKNNQWIYKTLSSYVDSEWEQLHKEFFIPSPKQAAYKIDVFIKTSQKHQLGSTRGAFVVLNAETINNSLDKNTTLKEVFRHELAHVIVNQLSAYHFSDRTDIMGNFFHEGLATLVDHNWNPDDTAIIQEAALHFKVFDQTLFELIPKLGNFSRYAYKLNYSLGYVFWGEFVKLYGQQKAQAFLSQLGEYADEDYQYAGINYLFYKSKLADIDLFKVFYATKQVLASSFNQLDPLIKKEALYFKNFKVARLNQQELLAPYPLQTNFNQCLFRKKGTFSIDSSILHQKNFSERKGGVCKISKATPDEMQINIIFNNGLIFYSPWIDIPESRLMDSQP